MLVLEVFFPFTKVLRLTKTRLYECVKDHNSRNHSSHLVKNAGETGHLPVDTANFEVIVSGYCNNACHKKIAAALLVKKLKPTLNIQKNRFH